MAFEINALPPDLSAHLAEFQNKLRTLTKPHGTDRALRLIQFKVPAFVEEMSGLGYSIEVTSRIGRDGVILTATLKE